MFNFTEEIKNEIIATPLTSVDQKLSMLSAFIRTSGSFISRGGVFGFEVVTENERTAEFFTDMLEDSFGIDIVISEAKHDILSGRYKLAFECVNENAQNLLIKLGLVGSDEDGKFMIFGIDENLISTEDKMKAYLKGAFLGGGCCTLPDEESYSRTGYHFEVVFANKATASNFCEILADFDIIARLVTRKDNAVVYVKSKEVISDLLNYMDCFSCLEKLDKIVEFKDRQNNENRVNNCSVSNIDKTLKASVNQVRAIEIISETIGLKSLNKQLFDVAVTRLADKSASMQELAERLNISKSCLNHRIRKILELAQSLN